MSTQASLAAIAATMQDHLRRSLACNDIDVSLSSGVLTAIGPTPAMRKARTLLAKVPNVRFERQTDYPADDCSGPETAIRYSF